MKNWTDYTKEDIPVYLNIDVFAEIKEEYNKRTKDLSEDEEEDVLFKDCTKCKKTKSVEDFPVKNGHYDSWCRECYRDARRRNVEKKKREMK